MDLNESYFRSLGVNSSASKMGFFLLSSEGSIDCEVALPNRCDFLGSSPGERFNLWARLPMLKFFLFSVVWANVSIIFKANTTFSLVYSRLEYDSTHFIGSGWFTFRQATIWPYLVWIFRRPSLLAVMINFSSNYKTYRTVIILD